jgi:lysophospholipase L1-like esterase
MDLIKRATQLLICVATLAVAGAASAQAPAPVITSAPDPSAQPQTRLPSAPPLSPAESALVAEFPGTVLVDGRLVRPPRTPEQIAAANAVTLRDWPALGRYAALNATLSPPEQGKPRVVFLGDSITQNWARGRPEFFTANGYVGRGISGQTSPQMVLRFHQDVIALKPAAVFILAGTNDIAENTGPISDEQVIDNLTAMVEMARAHRIKVVVGSVTPATYFFWKSEAQPTAHVMALNEKIKAWAKSEKITYADFWSAMAMPDGTTNPAYANDSVHPNSVGFGVMEPIATAAIKTALRRR